MIQRWMTEKVRHLLACRRGVNLTGARQVGKTTLTGLLQLDSVRRYTLDDEAIRTTASEDSNGFVARAANETVVIDEIQKVPSLLDAIKIQIDSDPSKGQYLLTGSSNLRFAKTVRDSPAGRLGHVRLRSVAWGEINGSRPEFLQKSFARDWSKRYPSLSKRDVIRLGFSGGYPEALDFSVADRQEWYRTYLDDLLMKDVRDVTEIKKLSQLRAVADMLLVYTAQFFAVDALARQCGLSKVTVSNYIDVLRAMYLFDCVPAWAKSDYDRIGKRAKWIVSDPGLVANVLAWNEEEAYLDSARSGKFVETWVYHELSAQADVSGEFEISHYRDREGREIDFMVESADGELLGIEVKAGTVAASDFANLKWFAANLSKTRFTGIVLYTGKDTLRFGDGFYAVPVAALG